MIIIQWPSVIRTDFPSGMELFLIGKGLPIFYGKFKLFRKLTLHDSQETFFRGSRGTLLGVNTFLSLGWSWSGDKGSFIRSPRARRICLDNTYIQPSCCCCPSYLLCWKEQNLGIRPILVWVLASPIIICIIFRKLLIYGIPQLLQYKVAMKISALKYFSD